MSNRRARRAQGEIVERSGYSTSKSIPKSYSPPKGPAPGAKSASDKKSK